MADGKTPFELMMAQAQEMVKAMNPALETFTPKGFESLWPTMPKEWMEMMFGNTLNTGGLDAKTRLYLALAELTMQGAQAEGLAGHFASHPDLGARVEAAEAADQLQGRPWRPALEDADWIALKEICAD